MPGIAGRACGWARDFRGRVQKKRSTCQTNAQIEGENHAVLAASEEGSNAELRDGGFKSATEGRQPGVLESWSDIRIFDDSADGSKIGSGIGYGGEAGSGE